MDLFLLYSLLLEVSAHLRNGQLEMAELALTEAKHVCDLIYTSRSATEV